MGLKRFFFLERYHFFHLKQEAKSHLEFATFIKQKASFCELGDFYVPALALVFTMDINDPQLHEKFLEIENCTLEQALAIAQKKEQITTEAIRIKGSGLIQSAQINAQSSTNTTSLQQIAIVAQYGPCLSCGGNHKRQNCKFREAECYNCHRKGHIAKVCRARSATARGQKFESNNNSSHTASSPQNTSNPARGASRQKTSKQRVNQVSENLKTGLFFVTLEINAHMITVQMDTRSPFTILSKRAWEEIGSPKVSPVTLQAYSYSGDSLAIVEEACVLIQYNELFVNSTIRVSKVAADSVLGRDLIFQLKLDKIPLSSFFNATVSDATLNKLFSEFPEVFTDGLGCCTQV